MKAAHKRKVTFRSAVQHVRSDRLAQFLLSITALSFFFLCMQVFVPSFQIPPIDQLEVSSGTLVSHATKNGIPTERSTHVLMEDGTESTFTCTAGGRVSVHCMSPETHRQAIGQRISIWWFTVPGLGPDGGKKIAVRIEINGKEMVSYSAMRTEYMQGNPFRIIGWLFLTLFLVLVTILVLIHH